MWKLLSQNIDYNHRSRTYALQRYVKMLIQGLPGSIKTSQIQFRVDFRDKVNLGFQLYI